MNGMIYIIPFFFFCFFFIFRPTAGRQLPVQRETGVGDVEGAARPRRPDVQRQGVRGGDGRDREGPQPEGQHVADN